MTDTAILKSEIKILVFDQSGTVVDPKVEISEDQVQARVDGRLQSQASLAEVEDRKEVAAGDIFDSSTSHRSPGAFWKASSDW